MCMLTHTNCKHLHLLLYTHTRLKTHMETHSAQVCTLTHTSCKHARISNQHINIYVKMHKESPMCTFVLLYLWGPLLTPSPPPSPSQLNAKVQNSCSCYFSIISGQFLLSVFLSFFILRCLFFLLSFPLSFVLHVHVPLFPFFLFLLLVILLFL